MRVWSGDVGTWHGIYEALPKNNENNVVIDSDVILDNCHGNIIKLPKGRLGVIYGLEDFIVAEKDNVLLICKKEDSSDLVRKYVNETQMKRARTSSNHYLPSPWRQRNALRRIAINKQAPCKSKVLEHNPLDTFAFAGRLVCFTPNGH